MTKIKKIDISRRYRPGENLAIFAFGQSCQPKARKYFLPPLHPPNFIGIGYKKASYEAMTH
jgi:hypothetical protein